MKNMKVKVYGPTTWVIRFYDCSDDDLREEVLAKLADDDVPRSDFEDFIGEHFEYEDHELVVKSLWDDGTVDVIVEDEAGNVVFNGKKEVKQGNFVGDPRKWKYDSDKIQVIIDKFADKLKEVPEKDFETAPAENDNDTLADLQSEIETAVIEERCGGFRSKDEDGKLYIVYIPEFDRHTPPCQSEITLEDDEEFDPEKLRFILSDFEGFLDGCCDSVVPVFQYDNTLYSLVQEEWSSFDLNDYNFRLAQVKTYGDCIGDDLYNFYFDYDDLDFC